MNYQDCVYTAGLVQAKELSPMAELNLEEGNQIGGGCMICCAYKLGHKIGTAIDQAIFAPMWY